MHVLIHLKKSFLGYIYMIFLFRFTCMLCPFVFSGLFAAIEEEPTVVELATGSSLEPLYLLPIEGRASHFDQTYLDKLEEVLAFDLNHNGVTLVVQALADCDQAGRSTPPAQLASIDLWKRRHLSYVVKLEAEEQSLAVAILDVQKKALKTSAPLTLSGNFAVDRRTIHRTADLIHRTLFGADGIASTHLLYAMTVKNSLDSSKWISEIWEIDYDGANARQLTHDNSFSITPVYLPPKPGFKPGGFLYVSYQQGEPKIYLSTLKGGKPQRIISLLGNQFMPSISRQRDAVAFISDVTGNPDLFFQPFSPEQGAQGKPYQIFSAKQATQGSPTISPDGKQVAFVSNKDGSPKIYVMPIPDPGVSLRGVHPTLITKRNRENSAPAWSPDGSKIAYCARGNGDRQIWVYDLKSKKETQVTEGPGNKENPSWAPNSLHLVYNSSDQNNGDLFLINLNQPEPTQITAGKGEKRFPSWEPR